MAIQRINLGTAPSGTGGDTNRSAFTKIDSNFADSANAASRLVGTAAGNVMEVGAFGLGLKTNTPWISNDTDISTLGNGLYSIGNQGNSAILIRQTSMAGAVKLGILAFPADASHEAPYYYQYIDTSTGNKTLASNTANKFTFRTTKNTSVDSNGFIKAASPIVKLFADKIELNDEAAQQKITFEKLGVGDYLVKGITGFAQEGWYIEMPKDANGNVLVAVVYEQLTNNDISVKTYAKMFDPETGDIVANTSRPRDIPATRWIDIRLEPLPQPEIKPFSTNDTVNTNAEQ